MARVTVEDCIDKVESPYELVLVAKERATQLNSGIEPTLDRDNDKNTVISLREIAEENIKVSDLSESLYKGEISKSGAPILPSKRARKAPEKIQVSKDDLAELSQTASPDVDSQPSEEMESDSDDVSLDEVSEAEEQVSQQDTESSEENS